MIIKVAVVLLLHIHVLQIIVHLFKILIINYLKKEIITIVAITPCLISFEVLFYRMQSHINYFMILFYQMGVQANYFIIFSFRVNCRRTISFSLSHWSLCGSGCCFHNCWSGYCYC